MAILVWQNDLSIGIDVIDNQHMRIVEMLNHLLEAKAHDDLPAVAEVIDEILDYTLSHFAFEEELMAEAGYPFCAAHKRVHEVFTKRVCEYQVRFKAGEDITDELRNLLSRWLFNHIRSDDKAYAEHVKQHLNQVVRQHDNGRWFGRALHRIFRGKEVQPQLDAMARAHALRMH